jgi:hypothetical protein
MSWAQVLDDFIKIGLPSLCTASVALLVAKFTRSHDFEKERRRRKQDFFEQIGEPLDDLTLRIESLLSSEEVARSADEQLKLRASELFLKDLDLLDEAELKFGRIETKLALFGFLECLEAFKAHKICTTKLKGAVLARSQDRENSVNRRCEAWWETEAAFREQIKTAFHAL